MTNHHPNPYFSASAGGQRPLLQLFVYGTLKRGFDNHRRFCPDVVSAAEAEIEGRIYELSAGYPGLVIPRDAILAHGTADPSRDLQIQMGLERDAGEALAGDAGPRLGWGRVAGEILRFDDVARHLPAIDRLEGFRPGRGGVYERVLAPVWPQGAPTTTLAWLYVINDPGPRARLLPDGCWPAARPG